MLLCYASFMTDEGSMELQILTIRLRYSITSEQWNITIFLIVYIKYCKFSYPNQFLFSSCNQWKCSCGCLCLRSEAGSLYLNNRKFLVTGLKRKRTSDIRLSKVWNKSFRNKKLKCIFFFFTFLWTIGYEKRPISKHFGYIYVTGNVWNSSLYRMPQMGRQTMERIIFHMFPRYSIQCQKTNLQSIKYFF